MSIEIRFNEESGEKELYLFGDFQASWSEAVDDTKVIIPYAIERAVEIGKDQKAKEIRKALGL